MSLRSVARASAAAVPLFVASLTLAASPASANVEKVTEQGFSVLHATEIDASREEIWKILIEPSQWWNGEHSFTGDAANFSLSPKPGGCFCEAIPADEDGGAATDGVEHMRVIYVETPRVLRMSGALGPLQSEGVTGVLNIAMDDGEDGKTKISFSYRVGGFLRIDPKMMAPAVDGVIGSQIRRLAAVAEGRDPDAAPEKPATAAKVDSSGEADKETATFDLRKLGDDPVKDTSPPIIEIELPDETGEPVDDAAAAETADENESTTAEEETPLSLSERLRLDLLGDAAATAEEGEESEQSSDDREP